MEFQYIVGNQLTLINLRTEDRVTIEVSPNGRFRAPLQIVISLLIWTYSMEELLNIFDHITKK